MPRLADLSFDLSLPYPFYRPATGSERALIFVHIPKTGGTSIHKALDLPDPRRAAGLRKHHPATEIAAHFPDERWQNAFKFAFVRNPYTRLVSHYFYRKKEGRILKHYGRELSFNDWVQRALGAEQPGNLRPQYEWVADQNGQLMLDYIGKFEQLSLDFTEILNRVGLRLKKLPHLNRNAASINYLDLYDVVSQQLAADFYHEDFQRFGYSKTLS